MRIGLFVLLWMLITMACGCVYVPNRNATPVSTKVGTDASALIRPGESDRHAVIAALGRPDYRSDHDLALGYTLPFIKGNTYGLLWGPCNFFPIPGCLPDREYDDIWLEFDESGILQRYEIHLMSRYNLATSDAWREFLKTVPDTVPPVSPKQNYSTTQISRN